MAIEIAHDTAADGTFSPTGATEWNRAHVISGLSATSGALLYSTDSTTLAQSANLTWAAATGQGLVMAAGTATTDVAALSLTRTNNNAAVATGVQITFTDTLSAAGFLPFRITSGSGGTTHLFTITKVGTVNTAASIAAGTTLVANTYLQSVTGTCYLNNDSGLGVILGASNATNLSWISNGVVGVGTGAQGSSVGTIQCKHNSSDGSAGVSGTGSTITCKDGIITAIS